MRLFIGIPLAEGLKNELLSVGLQYRATDDGLRWSTPESWHITLQFLGSTSQEQYDCITERLRALKADPVPVQLEKLDFFDRSGIFLVNVRLTPELFSLQQQITAATAACGFAPETRPYHPHITLARSKGESGRQALRRLQAHIRRPLVFSGFISQEFFLYESHLNPSGSQYEIRERFPQSTSATLPRPLTRKK